MTSVLALVFALLAPPATAVLDLNVSPSDASIYVDGKRVKPIKGRVTVAAGTRKVRAVRSGYSALTRSVSLKAGTVQKLSFVLSKSTSKKPASKSPSKSPSKAPVAKAPSKRPSKSPVKRPSKRPVKRPVAKSPSKRPVKKPTTRPRPKPSTKPAVGRRPSTASPQPSARPASPQPIRDEAQASAPSYRGYAIVSFLVGGAALAGGAYMGTQADETADDFNRSINRFEKQDLKEDTEFQATAANVLYGVGAAGIVLGALLWAAEPDYRYTVAPMPGGGTYVGFEGQF